MCSNKFCISIVLAGILCTFADAQVMDIGTNYYRDYLDFAQNKGRFAPRDTPLTFEQRNGKSFTFERIPDRAPRNNRGNFTSLGRSFVVTAKHALNATAADNYNATRGWFGNTKYSYQTGYHSTTNTIKTYNADTTYMRTDKYIVEGNIDPMDVPNLEVSSKAEASDKTNANKVQEYFKQIKDSGGANSDNKIFVYQAGTGQLGLEKAKPKEESDGYSTVVETSEFDNQNIPNETLGASLNEMSAFYSAGYKGLSGIQGKGVFLFMTTNRSRSADKSEFRNRPASGDSGSGFFIYDTVKKKWVLIGVLSTGGGEQINVSIVTKTDFDDYKKAYEHNVSGINIMGSSLVQNKDNILSDTNKITLNSNLDLGYGGIVVKSGNTTMSGSGRISKIAGFDIAEGASLVMEIKADTSIHKIGKGTLIVNSTGNRTLRLGQGTVELKEANAFSDIYLASGRGTLKLGVNDNLNGKLFFGNGGGTLDLNGFNQRFNNVATNSNLAKIINSNTQRSTLDIDGTTGQNTIFHAHISKNIDIKHQGNGQSLIFDGGFDIDGSLKISNNAKVTLQGHPTTHALANKSMLTPRIKSKIEAAGLTPPSYMDLTRPSTFEQPDWDKRTFKATEGIDIDSSELTIGKYAEITGEIRAKNSTINLSGDITHHIDKFDGSNIKNSSGANDRLEYQQLVESGQLRIKNSNYQNKIIIDSDSILRMGGTTRLKDLVINNGALQSSRYVVQGGRFLELEALTTNTSQSLIFHPTTTIKNSLTINNYSGLDEAILKFQKDLKLGNNMRFKIDTNALETNKKYELVSATNIINYGALFDITEQVQGQYYKNYTIENGKIFLELKETQGENPHPTVGVDTNTQNEQQTENPQVPGFNNKQNKILDLLKDTPLYQMAELDGELDEIKTVVKKIESDMNNISKTSISANAKALQTSNELINSRLSSLINTKNDISHFKLASLENDAMPTTQIVKEAANADKNSFWANINQAYFKEREVNGKLKFYGIGIGYDKSYDDYILGVSAGMNKAKFSSDSISDDATIYSVGVYGFYAPSRHEFQSNLNYALSKSKRHISGSGESDLKSKGVLLSNYYKYKFPINKEQNIKPVVALELGVNDMQGFKNDRYNQKDIKDYSTALGIGVEYTLNSYKNEFIVQFLAKRSIYNSENETHITLDGSNRYIDYKLNNGGLNYKLNLTANTEITKNIEIMYHISGMANKHSYGGSGSVKVNYRF